MQPLTEEDVILHVNDVYVLVGEKPVMKKGKLAVKRDSEIYSMYVRFVETFKEEDYS